jgi:ferric-dicitrate binding protein FerR (iron transport regulator)
MSRRVRVRPELPRTNKALTALVLIGIALTLVLFFRGGLGERTATFMQQVTHNPDLVLPDGSARTLDSLDGGVVP